MTLIEGYRIMFSFLNAYYWKNKSDELGVLLGTMSLLGDDTPAAQAYKKDWEIAVSQVFDKTKVNRLTPDNAYLAMIAFLHNWSEIGSDGTISALCESLGKTDFKNDEWLTAVNTVMLGRDDPYLHLMG